MNKKVVFTLLATVIATLGGITIYYDPLNIINTASDINIKGFRRLRRLLNYRSITIDIDWGDYQRHGWN